MSGSQTTQLITMLQSLVDHFRKAGDLKAMEACQVLESMAEEGALHLPPRQTVEELREALLGRLGEG